MTAFKQQIQEFNGEEQLQLRQGVGRYNLFTTLDNLSVYLKNKLGLVEANSETLYISIQDEIADIANGTHIPATGNGTLGIIVSIVSLDSVGNGTAITGAPNQVFNNVINFNQFSGGVFTNFTYDPTTIDPTHVAIGIYINATNVNDSSQMSFMARVPFGKGDQTVQFFIQKVSI
jgi:hypothetical protein